jgi:FKBP-type peptidyl-prolyl cis-trans isomerase 2
MKLGETKTLNIPAKDAYGESDILELTDTDLKAIEEQG